jgi:hypothetical protein
MSVGGHCLITAKSSCKLTIPRLPHPASKNFPFRPPKRDHRRSSTRGTASVFNRGRGCLSSCCITSIYCLNLAFADAACRPPPLLLSKIIPTIDQSQLVIRQSDTSTNTAEHTAGGASSAELVGNTARGLHITINYAEKQTSAYGYAGLCIEHIYLSNDGLTAASLARSNC